MLGRLFIAMIRFYQVVLSPLKLPSCRYYPTCSEYCIRSLREHGALKGFFLGLWRILRCHPFSRGGYDPVPPTGSEEKTAGTDDKR
jgi:putative membrane protein insertion efficiency factor